MLQRARHCLFDFDGTLINSSPLHDEAFRAVLARARPQALATFSYEALRGLATEEAFARLGLGDAAACKALAAEKRRHYQDAVRAGKLALFPGALRALAAARESGRSVYLVTSGSAGSVTVALRTLGLTDRFDGIVTFDGRFPAKPAPDLFLACLQRFRLDATDCLVIEDAVSGVAAAHAACIKVVGVNNPAIAKLADAYFTLEELAQALIAAPVTGDKR